MGTDEFTSNHSRPQAESEQSMLSPMDYESLLAQVVQLVEDAGLLLITEWQRPEGPRGSGDKADVDVEIESLLRPRLLQLLDCDFWGEETGCGVKNRDHPYQRSLMPTGRASGRQKRVKVPPSLGDRR